MSPEPAWTAAELRALIRTIPFDPAGYGSWWDSPSGRALAARIGGATAEAVARGVRARTGRSVDPGVVLGLVVEAFAPPSQLVRGLRSQTTRDPLAYLGRSLVNALSRELGTDRSVDIGEASWGASDQRGPAPIDLASAIRAVCHELLPGTPQRLRPTLGAVVERIVHEATEGSLSRLHTRTAIDEGLLRLGWSAGQLRLLVNAVIGTRPDHARASLIAGFLTDEDWRPRGSPVHRAAIGNYARRMAHAESAMRVRSGVA